MTREVPLEIRLVDRDGFDPGAFGLPLERDNANPQQERIAVPGESP